MRRVKRCCRSRYVVPAGLIACAGLALPAHAGGTPENAILIIDPADPVSLQVGNHYRRVRNIPEGNVLYQSSAASDYPAFVAGPQAAFVGTLTARGNLDRADYVILAPTSTFYINAPGLVTDSCSAVSRFSISSAYTLSQITSDIFFIQNGVVNPAGADSTEPNRYFATTDAVVAFSSQSSYNNGSVNVSAAARRYRIGALLGYTGERGNTAGEIIAMIDRSAAADGTRPAGTFYFMSNTGDTARNIRSGQLSAAAASINTRGGTASALTGVLPPAGTSNALGILTGVSTFSLTNPPVPLRPGSFADHVTSYGGTFDNASQTKISRWIAGGASASAGAVQEPCNYVGKFPHARLHVWYFQGLSLGEAYLRSMQFAPFQSLLLGDPLSRAFSFLPVVNAPTLPAQPLSGTLDITPTGSATAPSASMSQYELHINGSRLQTILAGSAFTLDTTTLPDGHNEIRILGRDSTTARNFARWIGAVTVNNFNRSATLTADATTGNLDTLFSFTIRADGAGVKQARLIHNGRVVAAGSGPLTLYGSNLGAGISSLRAEVTFTDNRVARSAPIELTIADAGTGSRTTPIAYSYTRRLIPGQPQIVELPAAFRGSPEGVSGVVSASLAQATIAAGPDRLYRVITPSANATGSETLPFTVWVPDGGGTSNPATITLLYSDPTNCVLNYNQDLAVNLDDLGDFITDYYSFPPIPAGLQPAAPTLASTPFAGSPCDAAPDAAAPYAADAYRRFGYRVGFSADGSNLCPLAPTANFPNLDNIADFITAFYDQSLNAACP
jgi:hypothetical protein